MLDRGLAHQVVLLGETGPVQLLELLVCYLLTEDMCGLVPVPVVPVGGVDAVVVLVRPARVVVRGRVDGDSVVRSGFVAARGVEPVRVLLLGGIFIVPCGGEGVPRRST